MSRMRRFGVAGGNGLLALEHHSRLVTRDTGVEIDNFGFDSGVGLPAPIDYRDMPYAWEQGFYAMDIEKLKSRLKSAKLFIGDVRDTLRVSLNPIRRLSAHRDG